MQVVDFSHARNGVHERRERDDVNVWRRCFQEDANVITPETNRDRTAEDAVQYLLAGASLVQVGTAALQDPRTPERIVHDLARWCEQHRVGSVRELTGALQWPS